jgi:hypothetical protein
MRRVLVLVLLVVVSGIGGPAIAPAAGAVAETPDPEPDSRAGQAPSTSSGPTTKQSVGADSPTIQKDVRLFLTPTEPGAVDVTVTYDVPRELTSLTVRLPADARDVQTDSFSEGTDGYEWDETTDPASIRFTMPANESADTSRSLNVTGSNASAGPVEATRAGGSAQEGNFVFADVGDWALVSVPQLGTGWGWRSAENVTLTESVSVAGEGSTGGEIAFLGPSETHTRTANGQTFSLVVPEAASLRESPTDVLDALADASGRLRVGARDDEVWMVAAPTDAPWGVRGIEYGGNDAWVVADSSLEDPGNVWLHEYVHTRQDFRTATSGRWITEASAEYYSAFLALRGGYVSFAEFETFLEHGEREPWRDAVLSVPSTWESGANYVKGSLVVGEVDRRIRLATDSSSTMSDVLWALNRHGGQVTNGDFLVAVAAASSDDVASTVERLTESRAVPSMWTRLQHEAAFDAQPPRMNYEAVSYSVTGPFRNETFDSLPTLYVGETLTVEAFVVNDGGVPGTYTARLTLNGGPVARAGGELAPSESTAFTLAHEFGTAGEYNLSVGRTPVPVTVTEPATVRVASLSVSETRVEAGDDVTVTVKLENPTDRHAVGPVAVTLAGEQVGSVDASLAPGETATRTVAVTVEDGDSAVLAAGNESVTLNPAMDDRDAGPIPGFGAAGATLAVTLLALLARRER